MRRYPMFLDSLDTENTPVEVVTMNLDGMLARKYFVNIMAARAVFPTLDPFASSKGFTWAMRDERNGVTYLRFENTRAYNALAS